MKLICKLILAGFVSIMLLANTAFASQKIGVIDMQKVFQKSPQATGIKTRVDKKFQSRTETLQSKGKARQAKIDDYKRNREAISQEERITKEREINRLSQELEQFSRDLEEDYVRTMNQENEKFMQTLQKVASDFAKNEKFDLILMKEASIFRSESADVTSQILQKLTAQTTTNS